MSTGTKDEAKDSQGTRMSGPQIYGAIGRVKRAMPAVGKSHTAEGRFKYDYRSAEDVMNAAGPLLDREGIIMVPHVQQMTRELRNASDGKVALTFVTMEILVTFYAEDGSHVEARVVGEAMDVSDKACTKAQTVGTRIALCTVLNIATAETATDPESGPQHEAVPQSLVSRATTWMRATPSNEEFKKVLMYVIRCSKGQGRQGEILSEAEFASLRPVALEAARRLRLNAEAEDWLNGVFDTPIVNEDRDRVNLVTLGTKPAPVEAPERSFRKVTQEISANKIRESAASDATDMRAFNTSSSLRGNS